MPSKMETEEEFQKRIRKTFPDKDERKLVRATLRLFENVSAQNRVVEFLSEARESGFFKKGVELVGEAWEKYFRSQHVDTAGDPEVAENKAVWKRLSNTIYFGYLQKKHPKAFSPKWL